MTSPKTDRLKRASNSKLTPAETIEDSDLRQRMKALLREAAALQVRMSEDGERLDRVKTEMAALAQAHNLKGVRSGLAGFECLGWQRRSTLQKPLLVDLCARYGAPLEELERCYVAGEPFLVTRLHAFDVE